MKFLIFLCRNTHELLFPLIKHYLKSTNGDDLSTQSLVEFETTKHLKKLHFSDELFRQPGLKINYPRGIFARRNISPSNFFPLPVPSGGCDRGFFNFSRPKLPKKKKKPASPD